MSEPAPVVIIGGGISGLSAAYYLAKTGIPSTLVERRQRLGGVIHTETVDGCVIEAGPDSFLSAKPAALELIHELGMSGEIIGSNDHLRVTYVRRKGRLTPLPDGLMLMVPTRILPMITTRLVGWPTKIRMGLECLRRPSSKPREDRSVADFIRDHYGQEAVDYLTEPLLSGVYGGDPEQLSISSVLTLFAEMEAKYGSLSRGVLAARRRARSSGKKAPLFQTLRSGLGSLIQAVERVAAPRVITDAALAVERRNGRYKVRLTGGEMEADAVVLACQAYEAGELLDSIDPELAGLLSSVQYNSSITVSLGYDRGSFDGPQNGFGFLVPKKERRRLVACTWVGTKFPYRVPEDKVMLRCFLGGTSDESDEQLVGRIREELLEIMRLRAAPSFWRVSRWPRSMAQYTVGHRHRVEAIQERVKAVPGLYLAGNAYTGIGVPDCARMGKQAAEAIIRARNQ
ncbi:MAG TPA: protoporphyrinogen oxidase [Bryobacteraceae bacterium]|nr:protoporphyrinogen oxidase [Bryobacteraceae bacterium]